MNNRMLLRAQIITDSGTLMELLSKTKELFQTAGNAVLSLICYNACNFSSLVSTIIACKITIREDDLHVLPAGQDGLWKKKKTNSEEQKRQSPLNSFSKPSFCTVAVPNVQWVSCAVLLYAEFTNVLTSMQE